MRPGLPRSCPHAPSTTPPTPAVPPPRPTGRLRNAARRSGRPPSRGPHTPGFHVRGIGIPGHFVHPQRQTVHSRHSRVPPYVEIVRDVSFWRLDHPATCSLDMSLAPHRPPFCRLRVFCRGGARAVPTRSTSPDSQSRRSYASHPSNTPIRLRSTADWGLVLQHEARDPGIASGGVVDLLHETHAHPMPLHRPRDSDGDFSIRFRSRYVCFWRVRPVARLAHLFCLWVGVDWWDRVESMRGALTSRACQPPARGLRVSWGVGTGGMLLDALTMPAAVHGGHPMAVWYVVVVDLSFSQHRMV